MSNDKLEEFKLILKESAITYPFANQVELLLKKYKDEYRELLERILLIIHNLGYDSKSISRKYVFDYLSEMNYFVNNGEYGHRNYEDIKKSIYDNSDMMINTYMPGLFLSYGYTTILYKKYHCFLNDFIPNLNVNSLGIEIGFGEGFYLWNLYHNLPGIKLRGFDISPYAKVFASKVFNISNIPTTHYQLDYGNIISGIDVENESMDYGILAEVIEHLPNPITGIREMSRILKSGGIFYMTTVIDSNHMDHISNFKSPKVIEDMLNEYGFTILNSSIYRIKDDYPDSKDESIGLAYVSKRI